jgi:transcriptional regulator with XRE-family HTH domain
MQEHNIQRYHLTSLDIEVARKIQQRRYELKMSQKALADKIGVTRGNIAQFEIGRNKLKHSVLKKIAVALNKPVSWFLGDEEKFLNEVAIKVNDRELNILVKDWTIKNYLKQKKVSSDFIEDLGITLEYLCELYGVDINKIW